MGTQADEMPADGELDEEQHQPEQHEPEQLNLDSPPPSSGSKFWQRHGFETHEDWVAYLDEVNSVDVFGRREVPDVGVPSLG
jgi:hypothetical protein